MSPARSSQRTGDYLEVLYRLLFPVGEFRPGAAGAPIAARVADSLGVSRASAGEMLKRLADQQLVERGPGRRLSLTERGIEQAEHGIRALRVLEVFLVEFLGYDLPDVHALAKEMRDAFSPEMIARLHARLGAPARCPHGWPIGAADAWREYGDLRRLIELEAGASCEIVGVVENDAELVGWLSRAGLVPGAGLEVSDVQLAAGFVTVGLGGDLDVVVGERAARQVFVSPPDQ